MFYNLLAPFEEAYKERGDQLIIENYNLKEGIYIQIDAQGKPLQHMVIHWKENQSELRSEQYFWFREADFYSDYISNRKCVVAPAKVIHSNNCLSVFMKKEKLIGTKSLSSEELNKELGDYFAKLNSERYGSELILNRIEGLLAQEVRDKCSKSLFNFFNNQREWLIDKDDEFSTYVRVFVKRDNLRDFKSEGERYLRHRIFNKDNFNIEYNGEVFGLSDTNMGLNDKKPYLVHRTTPFEVPFLIGLDNALTLNRYALWIKGQETKTIYIPQKFKFDMILEKENWTSGSDDVNYISTIVEDDQLEIRDFDIVPAHSKHIEFEVSNSLGINVFNKETNSWDLPYYGTYNNKTVEAFLGCIDEMLFDRQLIHNISKDAGEIKPSKFMSKKLIVNLLNTRDAVSNFVNKGDFLSLQFVIGQHFRELMLDMATKSRAKGQGAFNCYIACLKTFNLGGDILESNLKKLSHEMRLAVELKDNEDLKHPDLYAFVAGQVAFFVVYQSEKKKMNHDVVEHFLNKENAGSLNEELKYWYKKYSHGINLANQTFNSALSKLMAFDNTSTFNEDLFLAGFLSNNLFLEKRGGTTNEEE